MFTQQIHHARLGTDCLAQIGATRFDVLGVRFFNDNQGAAGAAKAPGTSDQGAASTQQQAAAPPWGDDPSKFDPEKAWKLIENLRTDAADRQTKTDAAIAAAVEQAKKDTLTEFGRLLTGEQAPETDPAKLNEALTGLKGQITEKDTALSAAQAEAKAGQVALQVALLGAPLGANIPALLANEQFKASIASVEPTDGAAITAEITKALQANAALKQPPARSGSGDHTGPTVTSLHQQLAEAEKANDLSTVISLKRRIAAAKAPTA